VSTTTESSAATTADLARTPNLNKALAAVQAEYRRVEKGQTADLKGETSDGRPYSIKYSYADLADISEIILPILGSHGLAFTCWPGTGRDGKLVLAYSLLHESGEERSGEMPLMQSGKPQALGSQLTYFRRYALTAVTGIAPGGDDDDARAANGREYQFDRSRSAGEAFESAIPAAEYRSQQQQAPAPAPLQPLADEDAWKAKIDDLSTSDEANAAWQETVDLVDAGSMTADRAALLQKHIRAHMAARNGHADVTSAEAAPESGQSRPPRIRQEDQGARRPAAPATAGDDSAWIAEFTSKVADATDGDTLGALQREIGNAIVAKRINAARSGELSALIRDRRKALTTGATA